MRMGEAAGEAELQLEDLTWEEGKDQKVGLMVVVEEAEAEGKREEKDGEWG